MHHEHLEQLHSCLNRVKGVSVENLLFKVCVRTLKIWIMCGLGSPERLFYGIFKLFNVEIIWNKGTSNDLYFEDLRDDEILG